MLSSQLVYEFLPKKLNQWTPHDVELWFQKNSISVKRNFSFQDERFDGKKLLNITPKYLVQVCGVSSRVISKKIVEWVENEIQQFQEYINQKIEQTRIQNEKQQRQVLVTERREEQDQNSTITQKQIHQNIIDKQQQEYKNHKEAIRPYHMAQQIKVQKWKKKKKNLFNNQDILITGKSQHKDNDSKQKQQQKSPFLIPRGAHFIRSAYQQCFYSLKFIYNDKLFVLEESGTIGRQKYSNINIIEDSVSRKHAQVVKHNNKFYIKDIGSKYGTYFLLTANTQLIVNDIFIINDSEFQISQLKIHKKQNLFSIAIKDLENESTVSNFSSKSVLYIYKNDNIINFSQKWRGKHIAKISMDDSKIYLYIEQESTIFRRLKEHQLYEIDDEMIIRLGSVAILQTKLIKYFKPIANVTPFYELQSIEQK